MSSVEVHVYLTQDNCNGSAPWSCTLGMKGAWKMSLGAEGCANSLHGKAEGARSWTVILICVLLQRLTDASLIIYSYNT